MKKKISLTHLTITRMHMSFVLPFGYKKKELHSFARTLKKHDYIPFRLGDATNDEKYYGTQITVIDSELEQYFLPYIEHKLFPRSLKENGFHRFTQVMNREFLLELRDDQQPFTIKSTDVLLGPFGIAFLVIKVELDKKAHELSDVLDFMNHFRAVDSKLKEEQGAKITHKNEAINLSVHDFLFDYLYPYLNPYMMQDEKLSGYFGSLPYYKDERMYAAAFFFAQEGSEITEDQLYRMGSIDGRTPEGHEFISTHNPNYIKRILDKSVHDRWATDTYTVATEKAFITVTNRSPSEMQREISQFMSTHYYNCLLHYFYKIMLLRVAYEYSEINWKQDEEFVKSLIKLITLFSSMYYFQEISTRSEGKELSDLFRQSYNLDILYKDVNNSLQELYKSQENNASGKMNMLLFVLTIFTVVSGIYGMNLVIEDWKSPFAWKTATSYTFLEWISLFTAISGIALSAYMIVTTLGRLLYQKWRKRKQGSTM
ncbi:hypothetical protein FITA111629_03070 [Filibacter tadaridae]|uniref:CorA-like Mg2+ transporter protein n=1 Tax=Filibacter tadaridae TaxID=2483811 RepID=A0A3P5XIA9_9BACL|nr:hypothetical protein [Filibacter tadaridae]VDC29907.1 hypothetical protein FILTAD_02459 [Filibacter tadaridae]